jgi:hypothetical protein
MPKFTVPKESLEGLKNPPLGIYEFRLDGFKPKWANEKPGKPRTANLRPQLVIINHPTLNDSPIFTQGNTGFGVELFDMCHALGLPYDDEGSDNPKLPGQFIGPKDGTPEEGGPTDDPSQWTYNSPLIGRIGKVELGEREYQGKTSSAVKKYICAVPNCTMPHRDSLL